MLKERNSTKIRMTAVLLVSCLMLAVVLLTMILWPDYAYAGESQASEEHIREIHNVSTGNKQYCFFVKNNVVLTPEEIAAKTDEELNEEILKRSGLYIKETNCKISSHKVITVDDFTKNTGSLYLDSSDLEGIRNADPADGQPVKLYTDLMISTDDPDEETSESVYSTYKKLSPGIMFIVVATAEDAASGEDICEKEKSSDTKKKSTRKKTKVPSGSSGDTEDMLPEYRTINMADRSGPPLEETLKDGTSVTLEWMESSNNAGKDVEKSFFRTMPGKIAGIAAVAVAGIAAAVYVIRKRKKEN